MKTSRIVIICHLCFLVIRIRIGKKYFLLFLFSAVFSKFIFFVEILGSFKLRWCRARDLFGSQIPLTTGGFEL